MIPRISIVKLANMTASPKFPKIPKSWREEIFSFNQNELSIRAYISKESDWPKSGGRLLYLIHGQGEQSGRYEHFAHYLNGAVDAIFCIDLPGHGKSQGIRGHIESFSDYSTAVIQGFEFACQWMSQIAPLSKIHWFGHSLGGLISLRTLFQYQDLKLNSVTVSAPLLEIAVPVPPLKKFFGELFEPLIGRLKLSNELDGNLVSHDQEVAAAYDKDPLNHGFVTPRFFVQLTKEMPLVRHFEKEFPYDLMMVVPLDDKIVSWKVNLNFYQQLKMKGSKNKYLVSLPNYYHESFNDLGKEIAFNALFGWISRHNL